MFNNVTEEVLWDILPPTIKARDVDTTQANYNGKDRGQTERFLIGLGDLMTTFFTKIEESFDSRDMFILDQSLLHHLQYEFHCSYIDPEVDEDAARIILENIIQAWRLKGTNKFLKWIIKKVFGWDVTDTKTLATSVLFTNNINGLLCIPEDGINGNKLLYDQDFMSPESTIFIYIDVDFDADFTDKSATLEQLLLEWAADASVTYINTP